MNRRIRRASTCAAAPGLLAWTLLTASCARIAGIEDAEEDPSYHPGQAGAGNGGASGASEAPSCDEYCDTVMANCGDDRSVYTSRDTCMAVCAALPSGSVGDDIGNSVGCRLHNAILALDTGEPELHCPVAGPGGSDTCGSDCDGYCVLMRSTCPVAFKEDFESNADCVRACRALPSPDQPFDVTQNSGPNVNCRLWHVSAATLDPGTHCPHAAGAAPCAE